MYMIPLANINIKIDLQDIEVLWAASPATYSPSTYSAATAEGVNYIFRSSAASTTSFVHNTHLLFIIKIPFLIGCEGAS